LPGAMGQRTLIPKNTKGDGMTEYLLYHPNRFSLPIEGGDKKKKRAKIRKTTGEKKRKKKTSGGNIRGSGGRVSGMRCLPRMSEGLFLGQGGEKRSAVLKGVGGEKKTCKD